MRCKHVAWQPHSSTVPKQRRKKRQVADQIQRKELKLLYVAPERLLTDRMLEFLNNANVSFFAIDEAHCISNWGHDFRPEYRGLKGSKQRFPNASVHAFTATASGPVRNDIATQLGLNNPSILVGTSTAPIWCIAWNARRSGFAK